jgi:hypothetical protein
MSVKKAGPEDRMVEPEGCLRKSAAAFPWLRKE